MPTYRAYRVDRNGKIRAAEWLDAQHDEAAKAQARSLCDAASPVIEVWDHGRLVGRVEGQFPSRGGGASGEPGPAGKPL
jgi:hypothetical protein